MHYQKYFIHNGQKLGPGTEVQFNYDFYDRHAATGFFGMYKCYTPHPSVFRNITYKDGKEIWYFNNCEADDLVWDRDVKKIVLAVPYVEITDKDRIREKKEQGRTWECIWPGTIIYVLAMIFITIFHERVWGWIAATILYINYRYEQLSK